MSALLKFLHVFAAIAWLGGIGFLLFAFRPAARAQLHAPQLLALAAQVLQRFFVGVWVAIAVLLATGLPPLLAVGMKNAPVGWHVMFGLGLLMFAAFGHMYFGPFRRLKLAVAGTAWPDAARRVSQIAGIAQIILLLGVVAIAAVIFIK